MNGVSPVWMGCLLYGMGASCTDGESPGGLVIVPSFTPPFPYLYNNRVVLKDRGASLTYVSGIVLPAGKEPPSSICFKISFNLQGASGAVFISSRRRQISRARRGF